jgi:hypothetical protein
MGGLEMSLEKKLRQLCPRYRDIQIENIDLEGKSVAILFPYESSSISIELEGDNEDEIVSHSRMA